MSVSPYGFIRVAVCAPELKVAAVEFNTEKIVDALASCRDKGAQLTVFPELCLTGYSCADLFYQRSLRDRALSGLKAVQIACNETGVAALVGLPLWVTGRLYNTAALIGADGSIAGLVPKTYLPNSNEFYEARWFTRGDLIGEKSVQIEEKTVPFGVDLLFVAEGWPDCSVAIEICEDLWAANPPSGLLAIAGASLIVNPSASNETLGKKDYRTSLVAQQSARCLSAYAYASAGPGESSTDLVYSGHCLIAENGTILAETPRFDFSTTIAVADVDLDKIAHERIKNSSFSQSAQTKPMRREAFKLQAWSNTTPTARINPQPFVPEAATQRAEHCEEIFCIQATGLAKRLRHTKAKCLVVGLSGGLDSTLAALVALRACRMSDLASSQIIAVTMPGFGTTHRTSSNAKALAEALGFTHRSIPIEISVRQHFKDIGHDELTHDVTFENAQARERTQILMDVANMQQGIVLGTGDLSELALGWCTYNGDHMSMYHVNAGVPKTLVRYLIEWCAEELFPRETAILLQDICATPISPELLPKSSSGEILQKTEEIIGPYELHDFFLFHVVRNGFTEAKIRYLATTAFAERYEPTEIKKWLTTFYRRFYAQQFKRSAMPDGPKVGSVALSPRGDWRMPSDSVCPE